MNTGTWVLIIAVVAGVVVGLVAPAFAATLEPVGKAFVGLIKMMIAPIIFCTIVIGIGSIAKAATVGKVGGLALGYFIGAVLMIGGGVVEILLGVKAEGQSLESIAQPLTAEAPEPGEGRASPQPA